MATHIGAITMLTESFGQLLVSNLISFAKEHYKGKRLKNRIDEIFNKEFSSLSQNILALCSVDTFVKQIFRLADGETIDAKELIDRVLSASVRWAKNFLKQAVRGRVPGFPASSLPSRIEAR